VFKAHPFRTCLRCADNHFVKIVQQQYDRYAKERGYKNESSQQYKRTVGERRSRGSATTPVMGMEGTKWTAMRVLVAPVSDEVVSARGGGGGGGGGGRASGQPTTRVAPPRRAPRARGRALCLSVMLARGFRRKGATV